MEDGMQPEGPRRKPKKDSTLTMRITRKTRAALEEAAAAEGRSVSETAERWMDEARDGRAQYHQLLGGNASLASAIEKLVQIARSIDEGVPDKVVASLVLRKAWKKAAEAVVPLPPVTPDLIREDEQTRDAWQACRQVADALDVTSVDDPVRHRADQPLASHGSIKIGNLLRSGGRNALLPAPDETVVAALEELSAVGESASQEIAGALTLVRRCVAHSNQMQAQIDRAIQIADDILTRITTVPQIAAV